ANHFGKDHSSLYHHINGGKSGLYVEVMTRHMQRHHEALWDIVRDSEQGLRQQLLQMADWWLTHDPIDIIRMSTSDFREISQQDADIISEKAHEATLVPIMHALAQASERGEIMTHPHFGNIAGAIFSAIQSVHSVPDEYVINSRQFMAEEIIDVMIRGLQP
ncbi:MAG: hypothetical protein AAFV93_16025, partial [Chloroflexota bacterium]